MNASISSTNAEIAELLRGDFIQSDYGNVILPFTLLRRLDCALEPTKEKVLEVARRTMKDAAAVRAAQLIRASGYKFYNLSPMTLKSVLNDPDKVKSSLLNYLALFSDDARDIFEHYKLAEQIETLSEKNLLYKVLEQFVKVDLHPKRVSNVEMGQVFEDMIRRYAELSNATAGEHFTPREVIGLMVDLLFQADDKALSEPGIISTIYDPTAGTGGMLSVAEEHLRAMNPRAKLRCYGQELNDQSYAICKADMMIKGQDVEKIVQGNTLSDDKHAGRSFQYMLSNPPFGVDWKKVKEAVESEHKKGFKGRFGAGLPRINDGSMLFLQHLLAKMRPPKDGGSRIGIVLNGSPLFTGGAGSGESEIRRWILESDYLEGIVALPPDMFYNTGISTYVWILTNHKEPKRRGKVQLVNAAGFFEKMRKSLGSKRKCITPEQVREIVRIYGAFEEGELCHIIPNEAFGYSTITVERPLRDATGAVVLGQKGKLKGQPQPDASLRDTENVPLAEDIDAYFQREVLPHVPDAWIDAEKTKVGYEIPFTRLFYKYQPPRSLSEIDADLKAKVARIQNLLAEIAA